MNHLGIEVNVKNVPPLDPGFIPLNLYNKAFLATPKRRAWLNWPSRS